MLEDLSFGVPVLLTLGGHASPETPVACFAGLQRAVSIRGIRVLSPRTEDRVDHRHRATAYLTLPYNLQYCTRRCSPKPNRQRKSSRSTLKP